MNLNFRNWPVINRNKENYFVSAAKDKLYHNENLFIDENKEYSPEQKDLYKKKIKEALELALRIHQDQVDRPDGPYVNHILRVSNRIIEEYGIYDPELVMAAILHDSVEDQAKKLVNLLDKERGSDKEKALLFIKNTFGERVEKIVSKLSNPELENDQLSQPEKNNIYKEHVKRSIEDSDVLPIKLSDFYDNALNLESISDPRRRLKLSKKYLPVMEVFVERLKLASNILAKEKIIEIIDRLLSGIEDTKKFIENEEKINSNV